MFFSLLIGLLSFQTTTAHGLKYHKFRSIDHRLGLDASAVNCIVQDNQGLIWMGTDRGLYNFDGYLARHFVSGDQTVHANNGVIYCALMVDSVHLWLGADNGLSVFNTYTDRFEPAPEGLPDNIRAIGRIDDHTFWIGSISGLYHFNSATHKVSRVTAENLPDQAIYAILRYDEDNFYFGTYNGLCRYNARSGKFERITIPRESHTSNQLILSLLPDYKRGCLWIGTEGDLFSYNPSDNQLKEIPLFKGNSVKSLLQDQVNCLWVGTDNGLYIFEPETDRHRLVHYDALNDRSLISNIVWCIFTDRDNNIWIGTDAGVSLYASDEHYNLQSVSELTGSSEGNNVISILEDTSGILWLGGNNGLIKVDRVKGTSVWYQQNSSKYPLPHNKVRSIFQDMDGDIWIATDGSVCRFNTKTTQFDRYQVEDESHTRNANWSYAMCQDETGKLWIATCLGGIFVVDKQKLLASKGKPFVAEHNYFSGGGAQGLSGNMLQFLAVDGNSNIWAGTYRAGVNKIDRLNRRVVQMTSHSEGIHLPSDDVTAMWADRDHYIWIAFRNSIVRLDTHDNTSRIITDPRFADAYISAMSDDGKRIWMGVSTGLFFIDKSSLKVRQVNTGGNYYGSVFYNRYTRKILAGGINEFLEFDPEVVLASDQHEKVYITSLLVNDQPLDPCNDKLPGIVPGLSIRFMHGMDLPYKYNNLTFTVSELNYSIPQNMQYANRLSGLDAGWHFSARGDNRITYNHLPPGDYTLLLARVGSDGAPMPDPLSFSIRIRHPWYTSWLAKGIYLTILILLSVALVNYIMVLNRLRYERIEKAKTMELAAHKIDFLTNISHELKTPLSLIIGPLGKIMEQLKVKALKEQLTDVRHNALKMGSLIHQMMEASRQEFDGFGLIVSKTDVVAFVKSVVSVFEKPLGDRSVKVVVESALPEFYIEADVMKLEVILNNILSNAAKFAPDNSQITLSIEPLPDEVKISVNDQGPGINPQDLPHIFERFYQSRHAIPQNKDGSGVGLSIVKEYVQLHRGTVRVISDGKSGTCVEIVLPVVQMVGEPEIATGMGIPANAAEEDSKPLLLIVEDNAEIAAFISRSLAGEFRCITAQNGKLGLELAMSRIPDVIVTDVMMPVMDGITLCRKLKDNIATSPIPVVMLTAKDDRTTELLSYKTGADAFIAKPFEIGYLSDRLNQLLLGRNLLMQKARQEAIIQPKEEEVPSADEKFLATITQIIENNLTNSDLNVNVLSEKSGYSMKQVYRRIKSLTGQTAVDYIRSVRLKKAAMLLSRKTFTVAEVMYMVGFSNHSYFARRFQEMYGKSPRQYAEEKRGG